MNRNRGFLLLIIAFFSGVSAYAMTFGFMIIPSILNKIFRKDIGDTYELVLSGTLGNRSIYINLGTLCFILLIGIIIFGFLNERLYISMTGVFVYFLPTFAHFIWGMASFSGIGILRAFWGPTSELNNLVSIIAVPIRLYVGEDLPLNYLIENDAYMRLVNFSSFFIALGFFLLVFGIFNLLIGIFDKEGIVNFWLYRYTRHPQYLGYILWSYGVYARTYLVSNVLGHSEPSPFPWLISTLLIIGIALQEEMKLSRENSEYQGYMHETSFLIPLPKLISRVLTYPFRLLSEKDYPETVQDIALVFFIYLSIIVLVSLNTSWILIIN